MIWSFLSFITIGNYHFFWFHYPLTLNTWQATREAIAQIRTQGGVLTTHTIAPHLSNRPIVKLALADTPTADLVAATSADWSKIDYVLLNVRHPGGLSTKEYAASLVEKFKQDKAYQLRYQRDDVYLFVKQLDG
jgi:hypothetical protein